MRCCWGGMLDTEGGGACWGMLVIEGLLGGILRGGGGLGACWVWGY